MKVFQKGLSDITRHLRYDKISEKYRDDTRALAPYWGRYDCGYIHPGTFPPYVLAFKLGEGLL